MVKNLYYILAIIFLSECKPKDDDVITQFSGKPEVPSSIKKTHEYILEKIHTMTLYKDSSRYAAIKLEEMMKHHFKEEEDFVLPPLGLLPLLANNQIPEQSKDIILLSEKFKANFNHMSAEHQLISAYIKELKLVSSKENQQEIIEFENEVLKHATSEEEVLFPTVILIGEYLKLKSATKP